jgi:putative transposase
MADATPANGRQLELYRIIDRHLNHGVPAKLAAAAAGVTERQFYRFVSAFQKNGIDGLARKSRKDKGGRRGISSEFQKIIEGICLQKPKPTLAWVHRKIKDYCARESLAVPCYSVVWRIYEAIPGEQKVYAHEGEKAYKHEYGIIHRWSAAYPNEIWQCDHKEFDIYATDIRGRVGKVWLTAIEDDYSRAILGYYLGIEAPSSLRVALALRQAIWHKPEEAWPMCGLPEKFFSDHGSDFTSSHIEQVAGDLKFDLIDSVVGEAEPRGKVERLFRTADQMFIPDIKSPKNAPLPIEDIDKAFKKWLLEAYLVNKNDDLDESPLERWKAAARIPRIPESLEDLDLMLLHVGKKRKVRRDGIRFKTFRYFDLPLSKYGKEEVSIRYDPRDMSEIFVYADGKFACKAFCKELEGKETSLREIIRERAIRKKEVKAAVLERQKLAELSLSLLQTSTNKDIAEPAAKAEPTRRIFKYFYERERTDSTLRN